MERGEQVVVVDNLHANSSSMVAAGLWNPIVFRRINKSWLADEVIADLEKFYPEKEILLGASFYHSLPLLRKHSSALEADLWAEKENTDEFGHFLGRTGKAGPDDDKFGNFPFGKGHVKGAGYVDLPIFLESARQYLMLKGAFRQMEFTLPETSDEIEQISIGGLKPNRIIDCRGYKTAASIWWRYLPFGLTKGEVITVRCAGLNLKEVFNAGFFVQPLGKDIYRVGATFNWEDKDEFTTEEARSFLVEKWEKHINLPIEILDQKAGVRPTVQDRRPLLGQHPLNEKLFIFNGLGTKGVMLAPLMSRFFVSFLLDGVPMNKEYDIARFQKLLGKEYPEISHP